MRPASCQQCGKTISQKPTGRTRRFCSGRCRQRSYVEGTTHRKTERSSKDIEEQVRRAADEARARALADAYHEMQKFLAATVRKDLTDLAGLLEQRAFDAVVEQRQTARQALDAARLITTLLRENTQAFETQLVDRLDEILDLHPDVGNNDGPSQGHDKF